MASKQSDTEIIFKDDATKLFSPQSLQLDESSDKSADGAADGVGPSIGFSSKRAQARFLELGGFFSMKLVNTRNPKNLAYATEDWETDLDDPQYKQFDDMLTRFLDEETCELLDADGLHPFALASKMNSVNFSLFKEVLNMPPQERNLWMNSIDEELQALYDHGT